MSWKKYKHGRMRGGYFGPPEGWRPGRQWRKPGPFVFIWFAAIFGLMVLLLIGGMAALAYLLTNLVGGDGDIATMVWIGGCGLAVALPLLAAALALNAFRGIARPLGDLMSATDAVAEGDLSVRVAEAHGGAFRRMARSFNRMVAELERSDQQRRNLTADVAHELRTPLHVIQGNLEGILDGVYQPDEETIGATLEETHLLARLVDDLRTLSQAEAGELLLRFESVDVNELLEDVRVSFSGQAEAAGIDLRTQAPPGLHLQADPDRLAQILGNLVVNALRHTEAGGQVTLSAEADSEWICFQVQDNGVGIAPEDLPFIFDRFWKGDRSRSHRDGAGHGLGLAIARQLVSAHSGRIEVDSQPGEGSCFTLWLPEEQEKG